MSRTWTAVVEDTRTVGERRQVRLPKQLRERADDDRRPVRDHRVPQTLGSIPDNRLSDVDEALECSLGRRPV